MSSRLFGLAAITLALIAGLVGCHNPTRRATRMAHHAGLSADLVQGLRYQHQLFVGHSDTGDSLFVFIDGDGSPWSADGRRINRDPTPRRPLALELAAQTPRSILYLGRPCYFSARFDSACNPRVWTSERYSRPVVDSLAAAVNHYVSDHGYSHVALIGYSGGGTLAVLMAPQVRSHGRRHHHCCQSRRGRLGSRASLPSARRELESRGGAAARRRHPAMASARRS